MSELSGLGDLIDETLGRWGIAEVGAFLRIQERWNDMSGALWAEYARPVLLQRGTLTVEATPGAVSLLRYATGDLLRVLDAIVGTGVVQEVRVRAVTMNGH